MATQLYNKKNVLNIAIVQPELYYPRGAERQVCELAHNLNKLGHKVTIYTFELKKDYPFLHLLKNVKVVSLKKKYRPILEKETTAFFKILHFYKTQFLNFYYTILLSKKINPNHQFINAHNYPAHWISAFTDIPVIWTCNEPPFWHYYKQGVVGKIFFLPFSTIDYLFSKKIKQIFCLDQRMKKIIKNAYKKPIEILGSGAQLIKKIHHKKNRDFNILFVGELHDQKRPSDIIKAISKIKNKIPNHHFHLIGGGYQENILKKMARDLDVKCSFYGRASNQKLYSILEITDLSIFVPEMQPWGIFPLESILAGIPTIISDECGVIDVLPKKKIHLVKTGNITLLSKKILEIHKNIDKERKKNKSLSLEIMDKISWLGYTKRFISEINLHNF